MIWLVYYISVSQVSLQISLPWELINSDSVTLCFRKRNCTDLHMWYHVLNCDHIHMISHGMSWDQRISVQYQSTQCHTVPHCEAQSLAHPHFKDLYVQYPSSFIQVTMVSVTTDVQIQSIAAGYRTKLREGESERIVSSPKTFVCLCMFVWLFILPHKYSLRGTNSQDNSKRGCHQMPPDY